MKLNKKQLTLGLLFVALASRMYAADDNELLAQAREFAQKLNYWANNAGGSIVSSLADSIEHLMPFAGRVEAQIEQIASLEQAVVKADRLRADILHVYGIQDTVSTPLEAQASQPVAACSSEQVKAPVVSVARMRRIYYSGKPDDALAMGKGIVEDVQQTPSVRAAAYELMGEIYSCAKRNFPLALEVYEQALDIPDVPPKSRAQIQSLIGDIHYRNRDLDRALTIYQEVLALQEGLTLDLRDQLFRNIRTIDAELHPQAEEIEQSNALEHPVSPVESDDAIDWGHDDESDDVPVVVSSQQITLDLTDDAPEARPNKRTERTESTSSVPAPTVKRPRGGRPTSAEATFACEVCDTLYTSARGLQLHEGSRVHRKNKRLKVSSAQRSSTARKK